MKPGIVAHTCVVPAASGSKRMEEADSLVTVWRAGGDPGFRRVALDLRVMLDRERGRLRASNRNIDVAIAADSSLDFLELVRGNNLGRLGDYSAATRVYERSVVILANANGEQAVQPTKTELFDAEVIAQLEDEKPRTLMTKRDQGLVPRRRDSRRPFSHPDHHGRQGVHSRGQGGGTGEPQVSTARH
jgi:hypothetical protein